MAILTKGKNWGPTDQILTTDVENLVDLATFNDPAEGGIEVNSSTGKLRLKDDGVTAAKLQTDSVTPDAIDQDGGEYKMDDVTAVTTKLTPHEESTSSDTYTVDLDNGNFQVITLTADLATIPALDNQEAGKQFTIVFKQDGNGPWEIPANVWNANWLWFGGAAPTGSNTAATVDIVSGVTDGDNAYVTMLKGFA